MRLASRWLILALLGVTLTVAAVADDGDRKVDDRWARVVETKLAAYGHRNWVAVVDSAYPLQVSPGMEMLVVGGEHLDVVQHVLDRIEKSRHVRPKGLPRRRVALRRRAPCCGGIARWRGDLKRLLGRRPVMSLPHAKLLGMLEATATKYNVLVLKTKLRTPLHLGVCRTGLWLLERRGGEAAA